MADPSDDGRRKATQFVRGQARAPEDMQLERWISGQVEAGLWEHREKQLANSSKGGKDRAEALAPQLAKRNAAIVDRALELKEMGLTYPNALRKMEKQAFMNRRVRLRQLQRITKHVRWGGARPL